MQKITDLSNYRNKKLLMNKAKKLSDYIFEQAKQGEAIHIVEQGIWDKLLTLGEQALGQFIALQGDGDIGDEIELDSGKTVNRLPKQQTRIYRSIFGIYSLERAVYGTREGQKIEFVPLD